MELSRLQNRITEQGLEWQAADTALSALASHEKARRLGAVPPPGTPSLADRERAAAARHHVASAIAGPFAAGPALPAAVDWRNKNGSNWVTPITDQDQCGSCVAFGCVGAMEIFARIAAGDANRAVDLSEADLWFCYGPNNGAGACPDGGWWPYLALPGLVQGIVDEACFPYTSADQPCHRCADSASRLTKIVGWHTIWNVADMKSYLATTGPLIACFNVYDDFYNYQSGVYAPSNDPNNTIVGGHCVCVVGYDDTNQCWICKNQWGPFFGENGFFRVKYGTCAIDFEMDAIEGVVSTGAWSPWAGLGGLLTSDPSLGSNADGRLELFARGANNVPSHAWQTAANGGWSGWTSLGGAVTSNIGVGRNADGRLEIFARGSNNALYHAWQVAPNRTWTAWASLGGVLTSDPAVASNADGRLEVFARGTDNALHYLRQVAPNGGWPGWASLGGLVTSNIAVGRNADGRLEVFARGIDNALYHAWQAAPGGAWSGWTSLGGVVTGNIGVGRNADGRLEVFARGIDNAVHHAWQAAPNGGWSGWTSLGGVLASDPTVASNADGRLEVFARGTDNSLHHAWQDSATGAWSAWASLGGLLTGNIGVGRDADGRLEVFARGIDNALYHSWQLSL